MQLVNDFHRAFEELANSVSKPEVYRRYEDFLNPQINDLLGGVDILSGSSEERFGPGYLLGLTIEDGAVTVNFEEVGEIIITAVKASRVYFHYKEAFRVISFRHLRGNPDEIHALHQRPILGKPKVSRAFEGKNFQHNKRNLEVVDTSCGAIAVQTPYTWSYECANSEDKGLQLASYPVLRWYENDEEALNALLNSFLGLISDCPDDYRAILDRLAIHVAA